MVDAIKEEHKKLSIAIRDAKNFEESQLVYDVWSEKYDVSSLECLGFPAALNAAEVISKNFGQGKDIEVLDIGTGTATVAHHLRTRFNFEGKIDILDANMNMLLVASKKEVLKIRNIVRHSVEENGNLPLKDNYYDVITSTGTFFPCNIKPRAAKGFLKVLKPGGLFAFNIRPSDDCSREYNIEFEAVLKELESEGKIEIVERKPIPHCTNWGEKIATFFTLKKIK